MHLGCDLRRSVYTLTSADIPNIFSCWIYFKGKWILKLGPFILRRVLLHMKFSLYLFPLWNIISFKAGYTVSLNIRNFWWVLLLASMSQCFYKKILKSLLCLQHEDIVASCTQRLQNFSVEVKTRNGALTFRSRTDSFRCAWVIKWSCVN